MMQPGLQKQSTLVHSIKDKYVIRTQHAQVGQLKFYPPNSSEAKGEVENKILHSLGDTNIASTEREKHVDQRNSYIMKNSAVSHNSAFLATSPITQDANKERPDCTLNMNNSYSSFMVVKAKNN